MPEPSGHRHATGVFVHHVCMADRPAGERTNPVQGDLQRALDGDGLVCGAGYGLEKSETLGGLAKGRFGLLAFIDVAP